MFSKCAYDRDGNAIYPGDRLVGISGSPVTVYKVQEIEDEYHAVIRYQDRPERFGNQIGYTSGNESMDTRDFVLTEGSRRTVRFTYTASIFHEVEIPVDANLDDVKVLAFEEARAAADYIEEQSLNVEIDDPEHRLPQDPGWSVPSEFLNGWMDIDTAVQ